MVAGPTIARALAAALLAAALLAGALLLGAGGDGERYRLIFENAGQLVEGNEVQVGGRVAGSVEAIELTGDNQAEVTIEVDGELVPLHRGTAAVIRATSLSGIANRYVALSPGPNSAGEIPPGGLLDAGETTAPVDLDQLLDTLDPATRRDLSGAIRGSAATLAGRGAETNRTLRYLSPALSATSRLAAELNRDHQALTELIVNSARLVGAVAERRDELAALVGNANAATRAIGDESAALGRALAGLPGVLRRANATFVNLRSALGDLDSLVATARPATADLAPFLRRLRPLVADARPAFRELRLLTGRAGTGNDLVELLRELPRLRRVARPTFARAIDALVEAQPVVELARPYTPELTGWLTKFGQGAASYDANGHYARIQPIFNAFSFAGGPGGGTLTPIPAARRTEGLRVGNLRRCPGAATQPAADGSSPFLDGGGLEGKCDPRQVPPGP